MATPTDATSNRGGAPAVSGEKAGTDLNALVQGEFEPKEKKATTPAGGFLASDLPALSSSEPTWSPPPMTTTFWQKMVKRSDNGIKPIHVILGGLLASAIIAAVIVAVVVGLRPPAQPDKNAAAVPAAAQTAPNPPAPTPPTATAATPVTTAPAGAAPPAVATPPPAAADVEPAPPAKAAKAKTRTNPDREEAPAKDNRDIASQDAAATPAAAPAAAGRALTPDDVKAGVKQGMSAVTGCIKAAREAGELVPGSHTLILDWTIAPSGAVTDANLRGPASVMGTSLPACFGQGMRKWRFPASTAGAPVRNFPFGPFTLK